jgi:hypothetical protein
MIADDCFTLSAFVEWKARQAKKSVAVLLLLHNPQNSKNFLPTNALPLIQNSIPPARTLSMAAAA